MRYDIQRNYYDFMHGALGAGFYFLKREDAIEYIYELIDFLYNTAIKDKKSCYFKWGTRIINEKKSVYNLALSHGISSIIVFLSRVLEKGITDGRVVDMLIGSVDYILSQQFDSLHYDYFPRFRI
jgi:Lanthionine synthetase C-like protein.